MNMATLIFRRVNMLPVFYDNGTRGRKNLSKPDIFSMSVKKRKTKRKNTKLGYNTLTCRVLIKIQCNCSSAMQRT